MRKHQFSVIGVLAIAVIGVSLTLHTTANSQAQDKIAATVNGKNITQKEVDNSVRSQLLPLEEQIYAIRRAALDNLVLHLLLEDEAKKQGISIAKLKKQFTAGSVEISAKQVDEVYSANAAAFGAMDPDEAKQRLELDLESQARMKSYRAAILKLKEASSIDVRLEEPRLPSLSNDTSPDLGSNDAIITLVEFSDFMCPYCRDSQRVIKQILEAYRNEVRLIFKHLPLEIHSEAFAAAQAAFCAGEQGLFWKYHDALFVSQVFSTQALTTMASANKLNLPQFKSCVTSEASKAAVLRDVAIAKEFGIEGTPAFIVNGKLVRGAIGFEEFKVIIERELKLAHVTLRPNQP